METWSDDAFAGYLAAMIDGEGHIERTGTWAVRGGSPMTHRVSHPRINCCIRGCKRGTTKFAPGTTVICGKCWRRAPKETRASVTRWQKRGRQFNARGDYDRAEIAFRRADTFFDRIRKLLDGEAGPSEGIDPLVAEELRKIGLL